MRALSRSSSNTFLPNLTRSLCCSRALHFTRHEARLLPSEKLVNVGFLHLTCVKHNPIYPVRVSSSLSPEYQEGLETTESQNQGADQPKTVRVRFQLQKGCAFGEQFNIVGNDPMLGLWDPKNAIPLHWSDGHVWTVELDVPIGRSIQYKFLLKGIAEIVWWQPGPNRILETWETANTIVVLEDWENAALQTIMEEELCVNQKKEPATDGEMLIVSHPNEQTTVTDVKFDQEKEQSEVPYEVSNTIAIPLEEELCVNQKKEPATDGEMLVVSHANEQTTVADVKFDQEKEQSALPPEVSNTIALPQEELVANNISYPDGDPAVNVSDVVVDEERASNKCIISHEEVPVLVPSLPVTSTEAQTDDEGERGAAFDASLGANEAENHKLPELDEKHETYGDAYREETINTVNHEEQLDEEFKQKLQVSELSKDDVLQNDIQWGLQTLKKLLASLGFLLASRK